MNIYIMFKKKLQLISPEYWKNKISLSLYNLHFSREIINLNESQWWSHDKLIDFQNKRLRQIIFYAYNNIPGYRKKFDEAGISPKDIKTQKDLKKLPITTREELQNNKDFVNKKLISATLYTGGSTGTPLKYYESADSGKIRWNCHLRGWSWNSYALGKKLAIIASSQGGMNAKNVLTLDGDLSTKNLAKSVKKLLLFKPEYLRGYVGSLYILARYCIDQDIILERIKAINPIAENLYPYQKKVMEKAFKSPVFEEYCSNDGGACAWECEAHEGLHQFMERAIIEEFNGKMIVTDLWNKAMPFIRYVNGDSVKFLKKKCSCNRKLPLINVRGRTNDLIITPKGCIGATYLMVHGIRYDPSFRSGIRTIQYIQKPNYILHINIVKNSWFQEKEIEELKKEVNRLLHGMKITINIVDSIKTTRKGKRQFIINEDKKLLKKWRS